MTDRADTEDTRRWYLVQLKPNGLARAETNLKRQGYTLFMPRMPRSRRRSGRFVSGLEPVFPGYLFVCFDPAQSGWRAINSTYGVARLVVLDGQTPSPVPQAIIDGLRARCGDDGVLQPRAEVRPGDKVRALSGPFADFVGTVEEVRPGDRAILLMEFMGRETRIQSGLDGLELM